MIRKILTYTLVLALVNDAVCGYAYQKQALFKQVSHAQRHIYSEEEIAYSTQALSDIIIDPKYGRVLERFKGKGDSLVIHIQDRHADSITQFNISNIINDLVDKHNVSLMCLESASSELDTLFYDKYQDSEIKDRVCDAFVKKAIFTGPEYYKITNKTKNLRAIGVEDNQLYKEHLNSYRENQIDRNLLIQYVNSLKQLLDRLKPSIYSRELNLLDNASRSYSNKEITLPEYIDILNKHAKQAKMNFFLYPNLLGFIEFFELEKTVDFKKAEEERKQLIEKLSNELNGKELQKLIKMSINFKTGKITDEEFYSYLLYFLDKSKTYSLELKTYNNLFSYINYLKLSKTINHVKVFEETEDFADELMLALCNNNSQRQLYEYSRYAELLSGLFNLTLNSRQFEKLKNCATHCHFESEGRRILTDHRSFALLFDELRAKLRMTEQSNLQQVPVSISNADIQKTVHFYELALKRDNALVYNTIDKLSYFNKDKAILISGGFHTDGITNILRKKDISYIVICPNVSLDDCSVLYEQQMSGNLPKVSDLIGVFNQTICRQLVTDAASPQKRSAENLFLELVEQISFCHPELSEGSQTEKILLPTQNDVEQAEHLKSASSGQVSISQPVLLDEITRAHSRLKLSNKNNFSVSFRDKIRVDGNYYGFTLDDLDNIMKQLYYIQWLIEKESNVPVIIDSVILQEDDSRANSIFIETDYNGENSVIINLNPTRHFESMDFSLIDAFYNWEFLNRLLSQKQMVQLRTDFRLSFAAFPLLEYDNIFKGGYLIRDKQRLDAVIRRFQNLEQELYADNLLSDQIIVHCTSAMCTQEGITTYIIKLVSSLAQNYANLTQVILYPSRIEEPDRVIRIGSSKIVLCSYDRLFESDMFVKLKKMADDNQKLFLVSHLPSFPEGAAVSRFARDNNIKFGAYVHFGEIGTDKEIIERLRQTLTMNHGTLILTVNDKVRAEIEEMFKVPAYYVGAMADLASFIPIREDEEKEVEDIKRSLGLLKGDILLLSPNSFTEIKNLKDIVIAMGNLLNDKAIKNFTGNNNIKILFLGDVFAGSKEIFDELRSYAHLNGFADKIEFKSAVSAELLRFYYAASDIVLFPAETGARGLVLIEANAMGVPVVCYNKDGEEVIKDGYNGKSSIWSDNEEERIAGFALSMKQLILDSDLRDRLGLNGIENAKKFDTDKLIGKHAELIAKVIEKDDDHPVKVMDKLKRKGFSEHTLKIMQKAGYIIGKDDLVDTSDIKASSSGKYKMPQNNIIMLEDIGFDLEVLLNAYYSSSYFGASAHRFGAILDVDILDKDRDLNILKQLIYKKTLNEQRKFIIVTTDQRGADKLIQWGIQKGLVVSAEEYVKNRLGQELDKKLLENRGELMLAAAGLMKNEIGQKQPVGIIARTNNDLNINRLRNLIEEAQMKGVFIFSQAMSDKDIKLYDNELSVPKENSIFFKLILANMLNVFNDYMHNPDIIREIIQLLPAITDETQFTKVVESLKIITTAIASAA